MNYKEINKSVEDYVVGLFTSMHEDKLIFHNLEHTKTVVDRAKEISTYYKISERDSFIVNVSAWFHDTGHLFTDPKKHEAMSVEIMKRYMTAEIKLNDTEAIDEAEKCIMATKFPRNPTDLLSQIICDADTFHFGTKEFKKTNNHVYQELELREGPLDKDQYIKSTIDLLKDHQFYTSYCKELLTEQKEENMKKLKKKLAKDKEEKQEEVKPAEKEKIQAVEEKLSNVSKNKEEFTLASKGIQTMLRLASSNHLKLSEMADQKARILIMVNSIIISVTLGTLVRKLSEEPFLTIPAILFLAVAVSCVVISILATRPTITGGKFTQQDIDDKTVNLMFFGNFYRSSFEEYKAAMNTLMLDTDYLYDSLIKDIYYLGVVLGKKYKLIRLAYNVFMFGIVITVVAFVTAFIMHPANSSSTVVNGSGSPF